MLVYVYNDALTVLTEAQRPVAHIVTKAEAASGWRKEGREEPQLEPGEVVEYCSDGRVVIYPARRR